MAVPLRGAVWCVPMAIGASLMPADEVSSQAVGDCAVNVLVGGGLGLLIGGLLSLWNWRRARRRLVFLALPFTTVLAGISFYPAVAATGLGNVVAQQRYERSGQAAADATEAARPILSLEDQLRAAGPAMGQAFPSGEIIQISSGDGDARTPRLGVGSFATGRPKRWCVVLREQAGSRTNAPYALSDGDFNPQAFSGSVGDCAGNIGQIPTLLRVDQTDQWPWLGPEEAVMRAEAGGGQAFRVARGGSLVRLTIRVDTDARPKWLAQYKAPGATFEMVMLDAQSGEVLCAQASKVTDRNSECHWGFSPP